MKVEIDIDELTSLKNKIAELTKEKSELMFKLESLNEPQLIKTYEKKAIDASFRLAKNYLDTIFVKLGFDKAQSYYQDVLALECDVNSILGERWYENGDRIKVDIHATVFNDFRRLTLRLGLISKEESIKVLSILENNE